jgi:hypothetical protein
MGLQTGTWASVVRLLDPSPTSAKAPRASAAPTKQLADQPQWRADAKQRHPGLLSLGLRLHRAGLAGALLLDALREANRERCIPPLDDDSEIVRIAEWLDTRTGAPPGLDASGAVESLLTLLPDEPTPAEIDGVVRAFGELTAMLDAIGREVAREAMVRALEERGVRAPARLLDTARAQAASWKRSRDAGSGLVMEVEPWSEAVDGVALLDELAAMFSRHVVMSAHAATASSLWSVHTHGIKQAEVTPRLAITSPAPRCGKTTLLSLLGELAARPLPTANVTTAAVFRVLDAAAPTLLIDEADTFLAERDELRGVLNSGHTRPTAFVVRCVGDDHEPTRFSTWGAVAIAAIGHDAIPATLRDRSIIIELARRAKNEHVVRWSKRDREALARLQRQCARWAGDHAEQLRAAPVLDELDDRAADSWGPLLAIADAAGGAWPELARGAAAVLSGSRDEADGDDSASTLLSDIRRTFDSRDVDKLRSKDIVEALVGLGDRPWGECERGRPLTQYTLGRRLARFKIAPRPVRIGEKTPRGYMRDWFADAWSRYAPPVAEKGPCMRASDILNAAERVRCDGDGADETCDSGPFACSMPAAVPMPVCSLAACAA